MTNKRFDVGKYHSQFAPEETYVSALVSISFFFEEEEDGETNDIAV